MVRVAVPVMGVRMGVGVGADAMRAVQGVVWACRAAVWRIRAAARRATEATVRPWAVTSEEGVCFGMVPVASAACPPARRAACHIPAAAGAVVAVETTAITVGGGRTTGAAGAVPTGITALADPGARAATGTLTMIVGAASLPLLPCSCVVGAGTMAECTPVRGGLAVFRWRAVGA